MRVLVTLPTPLTAANIRGVCHGFRIPYPKSDSAQPFPPAGGAWLDCSGAWLRLGPALWLRRIIRCAVRVSPLRVAITGILLGLLAALFAGNVRAQEHHHPQRDQAIHEKFYSTWMMPDNRALSCCHEQDCAPAESKFENGQWLARKAGEQGDFTPIPAQKVERDRDSPDGRSHLCGKSYGGMSSGFYVYCFAPGNGA